MKDGQEAEGRTYSIMRAQTKRVSRTACAAQDTEKNHMNAIVDKFGKNIFLKIIDADHFEVKVKVVLSPQFYAWVFGLKKYIRIIDEEARAGMIEHLKAVMAMYE